MRISGHERRRYDCQLVLKEVGERGQQAIRDAAVLVVGAGGLGAPVLYYLAAAGVGRIGIVDDDVVELSNLQRQILFTTADIGRPKAVVAAERLRALNPEVTPEPHTLVIWDGAQEHRAAVSCRRVAPGALGRSHRRAAELFAGTVLTNLIAKNVYSLEINVPTLRPTEMTGLIDAPDSNEDLARRPKSLHLFFEENEDE